MHPHRSSALGYASAASAAHSRVYGACAAEAAASETSGLSVGGCIRARGYFGPHPVRNAPTPVDCLPIGLQHWQQATCPANLGLQQNK